MIKIEAQTVRIAVNALDMLEALSKTRFKDAHRARITRELFTGALNAFKRCYEGLSEEARDELNRLVEATFKKMKAERAALVKYQREKREREAAERAMIRAEAGLA